MKTQQLLKATFHKTSEANLMTKLLIEEVSIQEDHQEEEEEAEGNL
jgi:hypothetical protein